MNFFSFEQAALRLKEAVSVQTDKDLAGLLGLDVSAYNKRKMRGSFPERELHALARQRPDLGIDVTYVLTGGKLSLDQHLGQERERLRAYSQSSSEEDWQHAQDAIAQASGKIGEQRKAVRDEIAGTLDRCSVETVELVRQLVKKLYKMEQLEAQEKAREKAG